MTTPEQTRLDAALLALDSAWTDAGPRPDYHEAHRDGLRATWPSLARTVREVVAATRAVESASGVDPLPSAASLAFDGSAVTQVERLDAIALRELPCSWCGAKPGKPCGGDPRPTGAVVHYARVALLRRVFALGYEHGRRSDERG